jgi:hypothetical protein
MWQALRSAWGKWREDRRQRKLERLEASAETAAASRDTLAHTDPHVTRKIEPSGPSGP